MKAKIAQQITQKKNAVNDNQADPWPRAAENNDINFIKDRQLNHKSRNRLKRRHTGRQLTRNNMEYQFSSSQ